MTMLIFILILSVLVLVHEFGHFITAKKSGIQVEEFGLGIPPRAWGKKIGGTIYSINWLPFGGFVKLYGEDSLDEKFLTDQKSFISKPWYKRILVIVAGVLMNFFLAVFLYYIFMFSNNFKSFTLPLTHDYNFRFGTIDRRNTVIMGMKEGADINNSGISLGDTILKVNGVTVSSSAEIRVAAQQNPEKVTVQVEEYPTGNIKDFTFKPDRTADGQPVLGVFLGNSVVLHYDSPVQKALSGFLHSYNILAYSVSSLGNVISSAFVQKDITPVSQSVSGPVGIYNVVGGILSHSKGMAVLSLLDFVAMLSLSLAFLNILPIPALDGGRLIFILIELVRGGKKLNQEVEARIHSVGMILLLGLFVLITIKDFLH